MWQGYTVEPTLFFVSSVGWLWNKLIGLVLLAAGVVLIVMGINAGNSLSSDVSRAFTGSPTDKTIWMLVVGGVAAVIGLVLTLRRTRVADIT